MEAINMSNNNYLNYLTARMNLENGLFSSSTNSKKSSTLADCSFLIGNSSLSDSGSSSYLDYDKFN